MIRKNRLVVIVIVIVGDHPLFREALKGAVPSVLDSASAASAANAHCAENCLR